MEAARERHAAIHLQHIQLTLDPESAQKNGTLVALQKLVNKEIRKSAADKQSLEEDRSKAFDGIHDDDQEFLVKQTHAGQRFDHFHQKLEAMDDDQSEFDIANLSEVSDTEVMDQDSTTTASDTKLAGTEAYELNHLPKSIDTKQHSDSPIQLEAPQATTEDFLTPTKPKQKGKFQSPRPWASDDEEDQSMSSNQVITQPQWTTTPA